MRGTCVLAAVGCIVLFAAGCEQDPRERAVYRAVNDLRRDEGLVPLRRSPRLNRLARAHARDMARRCHMGHADEHGRTVEVRADGAHIDWMMIGENVARNRGYEDPAAQAVTEWVQSPPHRRNILHPGFTQTGVGVAEGPDGHTYFDQVFVRPPAR